MFASPLFAFSFFVQRTHLSPPIVFLFNKLVGVVLKVGDAVFSPFAISVFSFCEEGVVVEEFLFSSLPAARVGKQDASAPPFGHNLSTSTPAESPTVGGRLPPRGEVFTLDAGLCWFGDWVCVEVDADRGEALLEGCRGAGEERFDVPFANGLLGIF